MSETFEEHWVGWLRPLLTIVLVGVVVLLWWQEVLPDTSLAAMIVALAFGVFVAAVSEQALRARAYSTGRKLTVVGVALASGVLAAVVPWTQLVTDPVVVAGELGRGATLQIPSHGTGAGEYQLHLRGEPAYGKNAAEAEVRFDLPDGPPQFFTAKLKSPSRGRDGRSKGEERHDVLRTIAVDLSQGGTVSIGSPRERELARPVAVAIRRGPPPIALIVAWAVPLLLLGAWLDARSTLRRPSRVGALAATAGAFGLVFRHLYTPAGATRSAIFALLLAAIVGLAVGWLLAALLRRIGRGSDSDEAAPAAANGG